ncbi:iron-containing alcohol dehydrogenase [Alkalicoccobacillus murimartini]|uniref:Alcohol dehydrogenase class IV n=1 Tax=Alkalicoccobacillus murimartini TaxID=171685 RepID=A0ABT9YJM4_9BACI|nr:iron-containing alcohol dehydrogenase [Alkalicoccobacillus murimartini]MDQ0207224.1 alcohol dehydrogenase class IV [Alkalicoccobacillus murimartini]
MSRFTIPRDIYFEEDALDTLKTFEGKKAALIIGGGSLKKNGNLDRIEKLLAEADIETKVFDGFNQEPTVKIVKDGAKAVESFNPDWIIGIGGGSVIDSAKAVWLFHEHPDLSFEDAAKPFTLPKLRTKAKFAGIPTTSGSGAEVSNLSVVTDDETNIKYPLADFELTPDVAIIDPSLVDSLPPHLIANTGMDAFTHTIEAYVAKPRTVFTDSLSVGGGEILKEHLLSSYKGNEESRKQVHNAQAMAGMSFANAVLGNVHSLAHKSGPTFGIPHGLANAIYLPYVIEFNRTVVTDRYATFARKIGLEASSDEKLVDELIAYINQLNKDLGIPATLKEYGVSDEDFHKHVDTMAKNAVGDPCTGTNPRETSVEQMKELYEISFHGKVPSHA